VNSSKTARVAASPLDVPLNLLAEQGDGKPAMIKILHTVTADGPDGQPWPPPDGNALWFVVRRADRCTLWRAIELAQVRAAAPDFCNTARLDRDERSVAIFPDASAGSLGGER
jgi:hypothetical protein